MSSMGWVYQNHRTYRKTKGTKGFSVPSCFREVDHLINLMHHEIVSEAYFVLNIFEAFRMFIKIFTVLSKCLTLLVYFSDGFFFMITCSPIICAILSSWCLHESCGFSLQILMFSATSNALVTIMYPGVFL